MRRSRIRAADGLGVGVMDHDPEYLVALAEARSCLAALADSAPTTDESSYFENLLIDLDLLTGDIGPATTPIHASWPTVLRRLEVALRRLGAIGEHR